MILIDNQPVKFDAVANTCHHDFTHYVQLANLADKTNFQVRIGDCPLPTNFILNGGFANNLADWTQSGFFWDNGKACSDGPTPSSLRQFTLVPGDYYKIELTVSGLVSTNTAIPGSGEVDIRLGGTTIATITENGTHIFFGSSLLAPEFRIQTGSNTEVCIDNVVVLKVNVDHIVAVYDQNDVFITNLIVSDFITGGTVVTPEFTLQQDFLTAFIDWATLLIPAGCYKICLLDSCVNTNFQNYLPNGEFDIDDLSPFTKWAFVPPATGLFDIDGSQQLLFNGGPLETGNISQSGVKSGCSYTVQLNIITISDCEVWVRMGTTITTKWTTAGIKTEAIIANGANISIYFEGTDAIANGICRLEYLRIPIETDCYETDFCSGVFNLQTSQDCTLAINACNDRRTTDDFGFLFNYTNFNPTIRVKSKLVNSHYDFVRDIEDDSFGKKKVVFYQRRKRKKLKIEKQPEYVHDFLSLLHGFDHVHIGSTEYFMQEDEYTPLYNHEDNYGRVELEITEKTELIRNTLCIAEGDTDCEIGGVLTDPADSSPVLEPATGESVLIPG